MKSFHTNRINSQRMTFQGHANQITGFNIKWIMVLSDLNWWQICKTKTKMSSQLSPQ